MGKVETAVIHREPMVPELLLQKELSLVMMVSSSESVEVEVVTPPHALLEDQEALEDLSVAAAAVVSGTRINIHPTMLALVATEATEAAEAAAEEL